MTNDENDNDIENDNVAKIKINQISELGNIANGILFYQRVRIFRLTFLKLWLIFKIYPRPIISHS